MSRDKLVTRLRQSHGKLIVMRIYELGSLVSVTENNFGALIDNFRKRITLSMSSAPQLVHENAASCGA